MTTRRGPGGRPRAALLAPLALAASLALAACGSSGGGGGAPIASASGAPSASASASSSPAASGSQAQLEFTQCLRAHGANVPDINPNDPAAFGQALAQVPASKRSTALSACEQYLPGLGGTGANTTQDKQALVTYIGCLQQHGASVDDPDPTTGALDQKTVSALQHPDATTQAAISACQDKRPGANRSGGS